MRVLIVDDEEMARRMIREMLAGEAGIEVVADCSSGREAVDLMRTQPVDLLFLDIHMPDLDGFDVLDRLPPDTRPVVVFVTAHDEHAVEAFRVQALDYLLKPFDEERFARTLARAREQVAAASGRDLAGNVASLLQEIRRKPGGSSRLTVKRGDDAVVLALREIDWIESMANYVRVHAGAGTYTSRCTLKSLEEKFGGGPFVRIHRSAMVNVERIARLSPLGHGDQLLVLRDGTRLTVSRRYRARLEQLMPSL